MLGMARHSSSISAPQGPTTTTLSVSGNWNNPYYAPSAFHASMGSVAAGTYSATVTGSANGRIAFGSDANYDGERGMGSAWYDAGVYNTGQDGATFTFTVGSTTTVWFTLMNGQRGPGTYAYNIGLILVKTA